MKTLAATILAILAACVVATGQSLQYGDISARLWRVGRYDIELSPTLLIVKKWGPFDLESVPPKLRPLMVDPSAGFNYASPNTRFSWATGFNPYTWALVLTFDSGGRSHHGTWRNATMDEKDVPGWMLDNAGKPMIYLEQSDRRALNRGASLN